MSSEQNRHPDIVVPASQNRDSDKAAGALPGPMENRDVLQLAQELRETDMVDSLHLSHSSLEIPIDGEISAPLLANASAETGPLREADMLRSSSAPIHSSRAGSHHVLMASIEAVVALEKNSALTTLQMFVSFGYRVCLYFHARELVFYVALYQDDALWRVFKACEKEAAEGAFQQLVRRAAHFCIDEVRHVLMEAQNERIARQIEDAEVRAERLRFDLQRHSEQRQAAARRQLQIRTEIAELKARGIVAQARLNKAQRLIQQLNVTNNDGLTGCVIGQ